MANRRFFFAGGGTGGHIYPALAIAEQLAQIDPDCRITFFCSDRPIDAQILSRTEFEFIPLPAKGFSPRPGKLLAFLNSIRKSTKIIKPILAENLNDTVVIGVGGFASAPVLLSADKLSIPIAMVNVDIVPGKANKFLARYASNIFVQFADTAKYFGKYADRVQAVGCPLRQGFSHPDAQKARNDLSLDPDKKILLITGASSGCQNINDAMHTILPALDEFAPDWQIVHLTGKVNYQSLANTKQDFQISCVLVDYYDNMPNLYAAADLLIGRAGAVSIAEFAASATPAICLPYPYHKDKHQVLNAAQLVEVGAAVIVDDLPDNKDKTAATLLTQLKTLMASDQKRNAMKQAAKNLSKPNAAVSIANELTHL